MEPFAVKVIIDKDNETLQGVPQEVDPHEPWILIVEKMIGSFIAVPPGKTILTSTINGTTYSIYSSTNLNETPIPIRSVFMRKNFFGNYLSFRDIWTSDLIRCVNIHLLTK